MKKGWLHLVLLLAIVFVSGCSFVSSHTPSSTSVTGEAWYTRQKFVLFFPIGTDVYYCQEGKAVCQEAEIR